MIGYTVQLALFAGSESCKKISQYLWTFIRGQRRIICTAWVSEKRWWRGTVPLSLNFLYFATNKYHMQCSLCFCSMYPCFRYHLCLGPFSKLHRMFPNKEDQFSKFGDEKTNWIDRNRIQILSKHRNISRHEVQHPNWSSSLNLTGEYSPLAIVNDTSYQLFYTIIIEW